MNTDIGKTLIMFGVIFIIAGIVFYALPKMGLPKLPGDIYIKKDHFTFYFPWVTSLVISAILSLIFYLFFRK